VLSCFRTNQRINAAATLRKEIVREIGVCVCVCVAVCCVYIYMYTYTHTTGPAVLETMLFEVAVRKEGCWEFKVRADPTFSTRFPHVHAAQEEQWLAVEAQVYLLLFWSLCSFFVAFVSFFLVAFLYVHNIHSVARSSC